MEYCNIENEFGHVLDHRILSQRRLEVTLRQHGQNHDRNEVVQVVAVDQLAKALLLLLVYLPLWKNLPPPQNVLPGEYLLTVFFRRGGRWKGVAG